MPNETRDFRLQRILKETAPRRYSVLPEPEEDIEVADPWQIASHEQFQQFVRHDTESVWDMLQSIRLQRDELCTFAEWYRDLKAEKDSVSIKYESSLKEINEANDAASRYRNQALELQEKVNAYARKSLDKEPETSPYKPERSFKSKSTPEGLDASDSSPLITPKKDKSTKLPDPPPFTDGKDPTWDEWTAKIMEKLEGNEDHFPTEKSRVVYVLNRIAGDASINTMDRRRRNAPNPFLTVEEVLDHLAERYEDTDRIKNARREFVTIVMSDESFTKFVTTYIRIGRLCGYNDDVLRDMLSTKIPERLINALELRSDLTEFREIKEYLVSVDNSQRARGLIKKSASTTRTASAPARKNTYVIPANRVSTPGAYTPMVKAKTTVDARDAICYQCGKAGHFKPDCTVPEQTEAGKKASQAAKAAKINEIAVESSDISESDSQNEDIHFSSDSGNA